MTISIAYEIELYWSTEESRVSLEVPLIHLLEKRLGQRLDYFPDLATWKTEHLWRCSNGTEDTLIEIGELFLQVDGKALLEARILILNGDGYFDGEQIAIRAGVEVEREGIRPRGQKKLDPEEAFLEMGRQMRAYQEDLRKQKK